MVNVVVGAVMSITDRPSSVLTTPMQPFSLGQYVTFAPPVEVAPPSITIRGVIPV